MNRKMLVNHLLLVTVLTILTMASCSSPAAEPTEITAMLDTSPPAKPEDLLRVTPTLPGAVAATSTSSEINPEDQKTGLEELDDIIHSVQVGDVEGLRAVVQYTTARCTFQGGLGGPPKCQPGESEGEEVRVLPFLGPEGHFIRQEHINTWTGIDSSELYTVYSVSEAAYSDPNYPRGEYAIAFINEARFLITILNIVDGHIVRVDSVLGNPPQIRKEDVQEYIIPPTILGE